MRGQYLEYQVRDRMVKTVSESDQNGGQYGSQNKAEKHINVSGSPISTNGEFLWRGQYLEYQVGDQMVKTVSESDQNGDQYGGQNKAGKHTNVSGSCIITNR